jgi:hypothetical protein
MPPSRPPPALRRCPRFGGSDGFIRPILNVNPQQHHLPHKRRHQLTLPMVDEYEMFSGTAYYLGQDGVAAPRELGISAKARGDQGSAGGQVGLRCYGGESTVSEADKAMADKLQKNIFENACKRLKAGKIDKIEVDLCDTMKFPKMEKQLPNAEEVRDTMKEKQLPNAEEVDLMMKPKRAERADNESQGSRSAGALLSEVCDTLDFLNRDLSLPPA